MSLNWDFSLSNAIFTVLVVGGLTWFLYKRLCREFSRDVRQLVTAPVAEVQLSEQLGRIEEKIARLIARAEVETLKERLRECRDTMRTMGVPIDWLEAKIDAILLARELWGCLMDGDPAQTQFAQAIKAAFPWVDDPPVHVLPDLPGAPEIQARINACYGLLEEQQSGREATSGSPERNPASCRTVQHRAGPGDPSPLG